MNTSFHYDGQGFFRKTEAYRKQREAYKEKLMLEFSDREKQKPKNGLLRSNRSLKIAYRMFAYRMRLLF